MSSSTDRPSGQLLAVGVDGAPGGWLGAAAYAVGDPNELNQSVKRTQLLFRDDIASLANWRRGEPGGGNAPVAVDIPIGLPTETEYRPCDLAARDRLLGPRKSSVFMPPGRYLLAATEPIEDQPPTAKQVFERVQALVEERRQAVNEPGLANAEPATIRGFSQQASGILLKVAEVDAFLAETDSPGEAPKRSDWLFEVHPEMCFLAMNRWQTLPPKTSATGQLQRLDLVQGAFSDADRRIRSWSGADRYSLLDICDAYAALWTALRWRWHSAGTARDPLDPPLDVLGETELSATPTDPETGLPMRMVV